MEQAFMIIERKLLKINILADILEAEIIAINPDKNILKYEIAQRLNILQKNCERLRKEQWGNEEVQIAFGELTDEIDEYITNILAK